MWIEQNVVRTLLKKQNIRVWNCCFEPNDNLLEISQPSAKDAFAA